MNDASKRILYSNTVYFAMTLGLLLSSEIVFLLFNNFTVFTITYMWELQGALTFVLIMLPALVYVLATKNRIVRHELDFGPINLSALLIIPLSLVGVLFFMSLTGIWTALLEMLGATDFSQQLPAPKNTTELIKMIAYVALVPAICEEFAFRGVILKAFRGYGTKTAVIVSGLMFGLLHGQGVGMVTQVMLVLLLGYIFVKSGSIWVPIIYHFMHNAASVLLLYASEKSALFTEAAEMAEGVNAGSMLFEYLIMAAVFGGLFYALLRLFAKIAGKEKASQLEALGLSHAQRPNKGWVKFLPLGVAAIGVVYQYVVSFVAMY